jgi:hypothetical protein
LRTSWRTTVTAEPREPACSAISALSAVIVFVALSFLTACRQDMHDQPKYVPLRESTFFGDDRSARVPVEGTVARG